jgi:hypothetical protein
MLSILRESLLVGLLPWCFAGLDATLFDYLLGISLCQFLYLCIPSTIFVSISLLFVPLSSLNAIWSYRIWPLFWSSEENGVKSFCSFETLVMLTMISSSFKYFDFILKILHGSVWFACRLKTHWTRQWWEMVLSPLIRYCSMEHPDFVLGFGHKLWPLVVNSLLFWKVFSRDPVKWRFRIFWIRSH